jgi:hypothetical protein
MNAGNDFDTDNSLKALSRSINRPAITLGAIVLALVLGAMRLPFLEYLRPVGDFYIALLQICVLPFLLATIPLAVRSAMAGGSAPGSLRSLLFWALMMLVAVAAVSVIIPSLFFGYASPDEQMITNIGALLGRSAESVDVEFAIDARHGAEITGAAEFAILSFVPTNIFASLSSNDSVRVLVFAAIFGIGMVLTERQSGPFDFRRFAPYPCSLRLDFRLVQPAGADWYRCSRCAAGGATRFGRIYCADAFCLSISGHRSVAVAGGAAALCVRAARIPRQGLWRLAEAGDAWRLHP